MKPNQLRNIVNASSILLFVLVNIYYNIGTNCAGMETADATVVLSTLADGTLLPPLVILKVPS